MNYHINLVKQWLADKSSVTRQELKKNTDVADRAYRNATPYNSPRPVSAYEAAYLASYAAEVGDVKTAKLWVAKYEKIVPPKKKR